MATDEPDAGQDPVERLLDLCVFAPLGFVTDASRVIPELAQKGRQQATVARMVGEFAVTWGSTKVQGVVAQAQEHAVDVLTRLGVASPEPEAAPGSSAEPEPEPGHRSPQPTDDAAADDLEPVEEPELIDIVDDVWLVDDVPASDTVVVADPAESAALAIPDYDNLSASQVVPRLDGLTPAELDAVLRYEHGHRHRKTILNRIAQLQDGLG
ncbi:MAG TPA: hypothetical protein VIY72_08710 [Acidimicrobiales bacterium]